MPLWVRVSFPGAPFSSMPASSTQAGGQDSCRDRGRGVGEIAQPHPGHPKDTPLFEEVSAERSVKCDGGLVPMQDLPFEATAAALQSDARHRHEEGLAPTTPPLLGQDVEILE